MPLLLVSFIAGVLTVLAPCILPVLPIIIGGSVRGEHHPLRPYIITGSLALSVILFTLILKFSTALIDIPQSVWASISGGIIILFGLITLFPTFWEKISVRLNLGGSTGILLSKSATKKTIWGDVLVGASLGPVFSSCSPTYFLILATVLPQNFTTGLLYLISYALGLALILLLIALLGQTFIQKVAWAANPHGWFKKALGVLFLLVGIFIITGTDKHVQTYILEKGYFDIGKFEQRFLEP